MKDVFKMHIMTAKTKIIVLNIHCMFYIIKKVVVNVVYRTAAENISLAQIKSQIDVLNNDFNATNTDYNQVPALFSGVKANVGISFVLDQVIRKSTNKTSWGTRDDMKKN
jgi:hypothetical protein